jgi:zinc transport system permease protein
MSILDSEFMRLAFATGTVVGLLAPAVGFFLVQRRLSLIGDGLGHVAFAGVAAGYLLGVSPVLVALAVTTTGSVAVEWLRTRRGAAADQALALLFYSGIAAGVVFASAAGAMNVNLFSFLFGSILTVTRGDLLLVAVMGAVAITAIVLLYRGLMAVTLDEEGARVSGLPSGALDVALAVLAAVTIAASMRIVGVLLIAALMVLPVVAASRLAWSARSTLLLSMGLGLVSVLVGLTVSFYADLAPGGTIVLVAAGLYLVAHAAGSLVGLLRGARRAGEGSSSVFTPPGSTKRRPSRLADR